MIRDKTDYKWYYYVQEKYVKNRQICDKKTLKFRKQLICKEYEKEMTNLTANNTYKVNTYILMCVKTIFLIRQINACAFLTPLDHGSCTSGRIPSRTLVITEEDLYRSHLRKLKIITTTIAMTWEVHVQAWFKHRDLVPEMMRL